ncbi:alpha/beta hydrolase fold domain-containing protein [Thermostilla marina]
MRLTTFVTTAVLCGLMMGNLSAQQPRGDRAAGLFDRLDRNRDGTLSADEFPPPQRPRFAQIDKDGDGKVTRDELRADLLRARQRQNPQDRPAGPRIPESLEAHLDIPYAETDHPRQRLDLLLPKNRKSKEPLPVIAIIHGGAWRAGDKRAVLPRLFPLLASGEYAGVSIGYRLSSDAPWPAQIHDCKAAIRWIRGNADKYGLDPDKIGVMGWSAGGHLVAMLGVAGNAPALEGDLGRYATLSSAVTCVVDQYGPTELLTMGDYESTMDHNAPDSPESLLIGGPILENKEKAEAASPIRYVDKDDAPCFIVHGTKDPLVPYPQSKVFYEALQKAGVESYLQTMIDGRHGGFRNPRLDARIQAFFAKHLLGKNVQIESTPLPAVAEGSPAPRSR